MATLELSGLATRLEELGLGPIPKFPEANVLNKPLDIGRSYLADILRSLTDCDSIDAYHSIQWPNDIFTADLTVPLPKLSHDSDPTALAIDLMQRVGYSLAFTVYVPISLTLNSSQAAPFSSFRYDTESISGLYSNQRRFPVFCYLT